ncbi:hypothetical protein ACIQI8_27130 [Streptomyces sp. NPDC092369]|uniref:hypothetical protein n=1 Tax=Streptomyces sp. NPDC092369 TaxID=3366015 RepID=UPI0037FDD8AB
MTGLYVMCGWTVAAIVVAAVAGRALRRLGEADSTEADAAGAFVEDDCLQDEDADVLDRPGALEESVARHPSAAGRPPLRRVFLPGQRRDPGAAK